MIIDLENTPHSVIPHPLLSSLSLIISQTINSYASCNQQICKYQVFEQDRAEKINHDAQSTSLKIHNCLTVQRITRPVLHVWLCYMDDLEYIEGPFMLASSSAELMTFFPSLEQLYLSDMPKLKGWWRDLVLVEADAATADGFIDGNGHREQVMIPSFPRLHELKMESCRSMTYFPPCPLAKILKLLRCNEALTFCMKEGVPSAVIIGSSSSSTSNLLPISVSDPINSGDPILFEELNIDDAGILNSLFQEFGRGAIQISIAKSQMDNFSVCKLGFQRYCASSLRTLSIENCRNLKSLSGGGIEHLTNLQDLYFDDCDLLDLEEKENMPWKCLHSLSSLTLINLPNLVNLPKGLQHVTTLQSLRIDSCKILKGLPQWLNSLCSLQSLRLVWCCELKSLPEVLRQMNSLTELAIGYCNKELSDRCREPDGEDWPKIRHISRLDIW
ncbi:hypothetical protein BVRB_014680 [Beta vulgaris subsp. vulgaris]|uniref:Disease resistance protein At4g27190-like leucine-rich repeats domain-containing protein n=1 Tax=Beta vulgaris subsp. vulgaris TaxID=3555 RepID=A0A0J8B4T3_BETVV|nr:hypothetical protein BVRB_014680 [Beta vulgaris subsp. vulgaris]